MDTLYLIGYVNAAGKLEIDLPANMEPGMVSVIIRWIDPDQAWFWTPEWQKAEEEADADMREGRYETFNTAEEFLAALRSLINDEES